MQKNPPPHLIIFYDAEEREYAFYILQPCFEHAEIKKKEKKKAASPHDCPKLGGCCILKVKR